MVIAAVPDSSVAPARRRRARVVVLRQGSLGRRRPNARGVAQAEVLQSPHSEIRVRMMIGGRAVDCGGSGQVGVLERGLEEGVSEIKNRVLGVHVDEQVLRMLQEAKWQWRSCIISSSASVGGRGIVTRSDVVVVGVSSCRRRRRRRSQGVDHARRTQERRGRRSGRRRVMIEPLGERPQEIRRRTGATVARIHDQRGREGQRKLVSVVVVSGSFF